MAPKEDGEGTNGGVGRTKIVGYAKPRNGETEGRASNGYCPGAR